MIGSKNNRRTFNPESKARATTKHTILKDVYPLDEFSVVQGIGLIPPEQAERHRLFEEKRNEHDGGEENYCA